MKEIKKNIKNKKMGKNCKTLPNSPIQTDFSYVSGKSPEKKGNVEKPRT